MFGSNWISIGLISDCTYSGKNGKHRTHTTNNNTTNVNNNNNNSGNTNNNNNNNANTPKPMRQFSISEDGPTITEDDLDNLINQSITEWQQRQKTTTNDDKPAIDVDVKSPIIS